MMKRASMLWRRHFAVYFATSVSLGAFLPVGLPMWVGVSALFLGIVLRLRVVLLIVGFLAAAVFASNALSGLTPLPQSEYSGNVVLVSDPQILPGRVQVDVRSDFGRLRLSASGTLASRIRMASAGSQFFVRGNLATFARPELWRSRHLRMSLSAEEIVHKESRSPLYLPVDFVRALVLRGASALPPKQRPVYSGFVIGDDRGSDQSVVQQFEDSGLSHLLVVSGQNVVFVLAILTPLVQGLRRRPRALALLLLLLLFAAVTRFEPSVLRASTMAMIAVASAHSGRPMATLDRLAIAVSMLVCIDPLLVYSFGFRLSTAATIGIAVLSGRLSKLLRGPQWLREVLALTISAQLAVAPLLVPVFGPMPTASIPANVLAEPVAAFVMMWGSSVGLLAGLLGGWFATVMQFPAQLGTWWIMAVAERCSSLPLPRIGLPSIVSLSLLSLSGIMLHRVRKRWFRKHRPVVSAG